MKVNEKHIDDFLDHTPEVFFELIKNDEAYSYLKDFLTFANFTNTINQQGFHKELVEFIDFVYQQENILNCSEEEIKDCCITLYIRAYYNLGAYEKLIATSAHFEETYNNILAIRITALNGLALGNKKIGRIAQACKYHVEVIKSIKEHEFCEKFQVDLYTAYVNLAVIFTDNKEYELALEYFNRALHTINKYKFFSDKSVVVLNISDVLYELGRTTEALEMIEDALNLYKDKVVKFNLFIYKLIRLYKAKFLLGAQRIEQAKDIIDDFIPISKNQELLVKAEATHRILTYAYMNKNYHSFFKYFEKSYEYLFQDRSFSFLEEILTYALEIATELNDKEKLNQVKHLSIRLMNESPEKQQLDVNELRSKLNEVMEL